MSETRNYPLGYSSSESKRLTDQAAQIEKFTEDLLLHAGLQQGMQVLDIGSGMGDVSLLASKIVGSDGAVLGIDKAPSSVEAARQRVAGLGIKNIQFEESDLSTFVTDRKFDVIIGRLVLLYVADPITALRHLSQYLKPEGIVVFQELDMSQISQMPASELFIRVRRWILDAFTAAGAELDMGTTLYTTFLRAGLPAPHMIATTPMGGAHLFPAYEGMVRVLHSLMPVIEKNGIATAAEIAIETLAARLHDDALANDRVTFLSRIVGAWARLP